MKLTIALAIALFAVARGACPNGCSGHGTCGSGDVCACYKHWGGGDCSYRQCPKGLSWTSTPLEEMQDDRKLAKIVGMSPGGYVTDASDVASSFTELYPKRPGMRQYVECSGRGTCDYATGQCKCYDGYEGIGCRRAKCPNDCSGHGKCLTNEESNHANDGTTVKGYTSKNAANDQQWDKEGTQLCVCDRGFTGYDCSKRLCPLGVDPTVACGETSEIDRQLVRVTNDDNYFTLTFEDMYGGKFTTRPIKTNKCSTAGKCNEVQFALMELPNFAMPSIEVDRVDLGTSDFQNFVLTFSAPEMNGKQNTLSCNNIKNPNVNGASPMYVKSPFCKVHDVGIPEWFNAAGVEQQIALDTKSGGTTQKSHAAIFGVAPTNNGYPNYTPCANKGLCDETTGVCRCANGHYGESCEKQSTFY